MTLETKQRDDDVHHRTIAPKATAQITPPKVTCAAEFSVFSGVLPVVVVDVDVFVDVPGFLRI